jgi:hypothetical protein
MGLCDVNRRHVPLQALELLRGFASAVQESNPEAQRAVVERVDSEVQVPHRPQPNTRREFNDPERIRTADLLRDREAC